MAQPSPWRSQETGPRRDAEPRTVSRATDVRERLTALRGHWGYVGAATGALITLVLMFQPWIEARGPQGKVSATPLGKLDAARTFMDAWSKTPAKTAKVTGIWGILACAAIVITVFIVIAYFRNRAEVMARAAAISSTSVSVLVIVTLIHLNSKGAQLKAMTSRKWDLGGQAGQLLSWAFGNGDLLIPGVTEHEYVATATFTPAALIALTASLAGTVAICAQWMRRSGIRLPRISLPSVSVQLKKSEATEPAETTAATEPGSAAPSTEPGSATSSAAPGKPDDPATSAPASGSI